MFFRILDKGMLDSNTYLIGNNGECAVIDPGNPAVNIINEADMNNIKIKYIFLTHTHYDHIKYLDELRSRTGAKVVCHRLEQPGFSDPHFNASALFGVSKIFAEPDILVEDGDTISMGDTIFEFIHTPGHTPGGLCIRVNDFLFTGDTLFDGDFGRTDLGNGSDKQMHESIRRIFAMDPELMIYPGHDTGDKLGNIILKCRAVYGLI